jgi:hypothetical protein
MRTGPVRGKGVAAIDFNADRYCVDCAKRVIDGQTFSVQRDDGEWEDIESANGAEIVDRLVSGDIYTLSSGGVVLRNSADTTETWHCGCGGSCTHALSGDEHDYDHDEAVGVALDT